MRMRWTFVGPLDDFVGHGQEPGTDRKVSAEIKSWSVL